MRIYCFLIILGVGCHGQFIEDNRIAALEATVNVLKKDLEIFNVTNEMLKLRCEVLTTRLNQQSESFNGLSAKLYSAALLCAENDEHPIVDVRHGFATKEGAASNCTGKRRFPNSCTEAAAIKRSSGIYTIQLDSFKAKPFLVSCDEETQNGGWTIIQRRIDGSIDFYRDWHDYKIGFGNLEGEFFIGLDKLHAMTTEYGPQELLIVMSDFEGVTKYAKYSSFAIGDESESYALKVLGNYSGDANDSLSTHIGYKFTTKDKKNDINEDGNCAQSFHGAWWYKSCHRSNLNGLYLKGGYVAEKYAQGVVWFDWHGHYYSLKDVKMMIRPKRLF